MHSQIIDPFLSSLSELPLFDLNEALLNFHQRHGFNVCLNCKDSKIANYTILYDCFQVCGLNLSVGGVALVFDFCPDNTKSRKISVSRIRVVTYAARKTKKIVPLTV